MIQLHALHHGRHEAIYVLVRFGACKFVAGSDAVFQVIVVAGVYLTSTALAAEM